MLRPTRPLILSLAVLAIAACAKPPEQLPPAATQAEKDQATDALLKCLVSNVRRYDDGTSDATTVASVVGSRCAEEERKLIVTSAQGFPRITRVSIAEGMSGVAEETAVAVVLRERARRGQ